METRIFEVRFYLEGNEDSGFYAWQSVTSPKEEYGWGATASEVVSNLCRFLNGEFTKPIEQANRDLPPPEEWEFDEDAFYDNLVAKEAIQEEAKG